MRTTTENIYGIVDTRTVQLYEFHELSEDVRARIVDEYREERENNPYFSQYFVDAYERDIWECVRTLEKSITGARVQWRYNRWYSCDFDCEFSYDDCCDPGEMERVKDTGYYASMDLCDAWNSHIAKLNAICYRVDYLESLIYGEYDVWGPHYVYMKYNEAAYNRLETMRDSLISAWYEELEAACEDVRNTIEALLRAEWDYYTSEEYARMECEDETTQGGEWRTCEYPYYKNGGYTGRVYYSDNRKWYTADGEFYEQSDVTRECISIVKAA